MSFQPIELRFWHPAQAKAALLRVLPQVGEALASGAQLVLSIKLLTRTCAQNKKLHAMFGDIAASGWEFMGQRLDRDDVKRLMVDAFHRATRHDPDIAPLWAGFGSPRTMPSLDGTGVVTLGIPTRQFPKALASAMIDWLQAWMIENNIDLAEGEASQWQEAA
jgi:hypothetical protein